MNSVFGGIAIIYNFLAQNFNNTIAQTLEDLSVFAKMSALGSGLISLALFEISKGGQTPTIYSSLAKIVIYYAEIVALVFGTLHTLTYFGIICVGCSALDLQTEEEVTAPSNENEVTASSL